MIALNHVAAFGGDSGRHSLSDPLLRIALNGTTMMHNSLVRFLHPLDSENKVASACDLADIIDLAAGLRIKRRLIKDYGCAIIRHPSDTGFQGGCVVDKLRLDSQSHGFRHGLIFEAGLSARSLALLIERRFESGRVNCQSGLARENFGKIQREAECVIEFECLVAGNHALFCKHLGFLESLQTGIERLGKPRFFGLDHMLDVMATGFQFGICIAHHVDNHADKSVQKWPMISERLPMSCRAPEDPAQHVSGALIPGHPAIGDGECQATQVIGTHPVGNALVPCFIRNSAVCSNRSDDWLK